MTVYADSTSVSNPVVPGSNTVLCHGPLRRNTLSGRGGYDCLVKVFKTKLSSPKRSSLLLKSIACSFEYFYRAVMAATVWRCDAAEQTAAQTVLHHIHLPLPLPLHIKNEDGHLYNYLPGFHSIYFYYSVDKSLLIVL